MIRPGQITDWKQAIDNVVHGDCFDLMKMIPSKSIDLCVTDPPYNSTSCDWEFDLMKKISLFWLELERVVKDNGAIVTMASQPFTSKIVMSNIKNFRYELIWHKSTSGGFALAKKMPMKFHENILVFYRKLPTYNPQFQQYSESTKKKFSSGDFVKRDAQLLKSTNKIHGGLSLAGKSCLDFERGKYPESVLSIKSDPASGHRLHPTQKPLELFSYIIKTYSNDGDLILDPFMGSWTTARACKNLGRHFIGAELEEKYAIIADKRLEQDVLF